MCKNNIFTDKSSHIANLMMITKAIQINTKIQKLDMSVNNISDDGAAIISDTLMISESLKELNLQ